MAEMEDLFRRWRKARGRAEKHRAGERLMEEIWVKYHPRLQVFLGDIPAGEREDRVSEILLRVFESLEHYNPEYAFSTWLYRIARNCRIDQYRRRGPVLVEWDEEIHSPDGAGETPEGILLRETERDLLARAVGSLKQTDRELLYLAFFEGMTYGEISRVTGRPVGTIKYEMHRIRRALKFRLEEDFCCDAK